ncbi:50S ribosomal protein L19e [Candidatus Woesearchaeota archaeon]|nr:50S ribosomal protein L19e [Candidatus Woesearchaeota archaeon]
MQLNMQKRLAADVLKSSKSNVILDTNRLEEIKEAITKEDIRALINDNAIWSKNTRGISRYRTRKRKLQKLKGRRSGAGSIKGGRHARLPQKKGWAQHIRVQREFLQNLRDKGAIDKSLYRALYLKSKGGFFRSKRHIKIYLQEHGKK